MGMTCETLMRPSGESGRPQHHGDQLTEAELVHAAELLGSQLGRKDAQEAAAIVLGWLSAADGDGSLDASQPGLGSPTPGAPLSSGGGERRFSVSGPVRTAGAAVLAAVAVILWFTMAPDDVPDRSIVVDMAVADYEGNEARTHKAPQQQVVNGWVAKDLLTIVAEQADDSAHADQQAADRLAAEAVLVVVALAFGIATRPPAGRRPDRDPARRCTRRWVSRERPLRDSPRRAVARGTRQSPQRWAPALRRRGPTEMSWPVSVTPRR